MDVIVGNDIAVRIQGMEMDGGAEIVDRAAIVDVVPGNDIADRPGKAARYRMHRRQPAAPNRRKIVGPEIEVGDADSLAAGPDNLIANDPIVGAEAMEADGVASDLVEAAFLNRAVLSILEVESVAG